MPRHRVSEPTENPQPEAPGWGCDLRLPQKNTLQRLEARFAALECIVSFEPTGLLLHVALRLRSSPDGCERTARDVIPAFQLARLGSTGWLPSLAAFTRAIQEIHQGGVYIGEPTIIAAIVSQDFPGAKSAFDIHPAASLRIALQVVHGALFPDLNLVPLGVLFQLLCYGLSTSQWCRQKNWLRDHRLAKHELWGFAHVPQKHSSIH